MPRPHRLAPLALPLLLSAPLLAQADDCANATDLGVGPTTAPFDTNACTDTGTLATTSQEQQCISLSNDVWFRYTASQTGLATFSTCDDATFDTEIGVWGGADCSTMAALGCNDDFSGCPDFTSSITVSVTAGTTYHVQVGYWSSAPTVWGTGNLTITEENDLCGMQMADPFEENDDCATAAPLPSGSYPSLNVARTDRDFYGLALPPGASVDVSALFANAEGDIDIYLFDPLIACDTAIVGEGSSSGSLALGFSATDNETLSYTNPTNAAQDLILEVRLWTGSAASCNSYGLNIDIGPERIGSSYCTAAANSTGDVGRISAFGSTSVAANDIELVAEGLPTLQMGFFLSSLTQDFLPGVAGVSDGNLCVGGRIDRLVGPGQMLTSDVTGQFRLQLDLARFPDGSASTMVLAGDERNFQAWHRDTTGLGSNLTDGVTVLFTN